MTHVNDLFLRENVTQPEVRVNIALFSLMQQNWFRKWFLEKLCLPTHAIVYPPTNTSGGRPDLKIVDAGPSTVAWIEVELSKDPGQLDSFRKEHTPIPVKAVWGTPADGGDLSLEEIAAYLNKKKKRGLPLQTSVNVQQLVELIKDGLEGYKTNSKRQKLSESMKEDNPLVAGLIERIGSRILIDLHGNEPPSPGFLKADTTAAENNRGFSLRVYSPESSSSRSLSIMSIQSGRPRVYFPSLLKLKRYLPYCPAAIEEYRSALCQMKLDIRKFDENQRPHLPLNVVVDQLDVLLPGLRALAECYGDCKEESVLDG